jgi:hypothetical protein
MDVVLIAIMFRSNFRPLDFEFALVEAYGPELITGVDIQWKNGKQITVWPRDKANAKMCD